MVASSPTQRTQLKRHPERGSYDPRVVHDILDAALLCHVAFVREGQPYVIPTAHVRVGDELFLHGAKKNRMLAALVEGVSACVSVTLLDGLVLARSAMHHSMNYRSVVIFGRGREVEDAQEKRRVLAALVDHVTPGRSLEVREPNDAELSATRVVAFPVGEASAKIRRGPPLDLASDLERPCWAGVVPLELRALRPEPASDLVDGAAIAPLDVGGARFE